MVIIRGFDVDMSKRPETYKTLLKEEYGVNTKTTSVRRRVNKLVKYGIISSKTIRNKIEYGKCKIFFVIQKEYYILYTKDRCFYCDTISQDKDDLVLHKAYELNCIDWVSKGDIKIKAKEVEECF